MSDGKQAETRDVGFFKLSLVALGLRGFAQAFSSWGKQGAALCCSTWASH